MVKLIVKLHDSGQVKTYFGSEEDVESRLRKLFPEETAQHGRLLSCVKAVNDSGFAEVEVEPVKPSDINSNLLPKGYLTQEQGEDPWLRRG